MRAMIGLTLWLCLVVCARKGVCYVKTPAEGAWGGFPAEACEAKRALFPERTPPIALPSLISSRGLVLPRDGELFLSEYTILNIYSDEHNDKSGKCTRGDIDYKEPIPFKWMSLHNWEITPEPENLEAIPHLDRIPCQSDEVLFQKDLSMTVVLPDIPQNVKRVNVSGQILSDDDEWGLFVLRGGTDTLQFQLPDSFDANQELGVSVLRNGRGCSEEQEDTRWSCPCQTRLGNTTALCADERCGEPDCSNPVKPHGFCCPICGGYAILEVYGESKMHSVTTMLEKSLNESCDRKSSVWSVTVRQPSVQNAKARVLQVVVSEKESGAGKACIQAIMNVAYKESGSIRLASWWDEGFAGPAYSGGGSVLWWLFAILVLLCVAAAAYLRYRNHPQLLRIQSRLTTLIAARPRLNGLYVRFHSMRGRSGGEEQPFEDVNLDARRDSTVSYTRLSPLPVLKRHSQKLERAEAQREVVSEDITATRFSDLVTKQSHQE